MHVELEPAAGLPPVWVDRAQFEAAILNLVANGRDAMPDGGNIRIGARALQTRDPAAVEDSERLHVCVDVTDDGQGIAPDIQPHVFEPFFTTKEVGKGSGLGLSQVFGFAAQSGGYAELHSQVGQGTRVRICLPVGEDAA